MNSVLAALQAIEIAPHIAAARLPEGVKAGLLYREGKWDQAHSVAQEMDCPEGSFWHAILHRSEGDWSNSAYWFRQVVRPHVYPLIHADAASMLGVQRDLKWKTGDAWDPLKFNEWCREAAAMPGSEKERMVIDIQVVEWKHLFNWCLQ